jgi:RNA polymerase sigma-70 factor, ECF subfamily
MQAEPAALPRAGQTGSDEPIVALLRAGDEHAFRELYRHQYPAMKRMARSYVESDAVAEEVVQETWVGILTAIERFEGRCALSTWMFSILINQAKSHSSRERRAVPLSAISPGGGDEPAVDADRFQTDDEAWPGHWATPPRPWQKPDRRALSLEARELLKQALSELPDRQRLIVGLRDVEAFSSGEVCSLLGLSPENERVLLHRGRSRLRTALAEYVEGADA